MNKLRRDALAVLKTGLSAIDTQAAVRRICQLDGSVLKIGTHRYRLDKFDHVYVIGFGKASLEAAKALEQILGSRISDGIVLDVKRAPLKRIKSVAGTHPFPSMANMRATGEIMAMLKHVDSRDLVIAVVSGGGSALLCWPYQLKCDDITLLTKILMAKGASISETNIVRKHLSEIQGGQFARLAHPATVVGLIFSDVPGDDLGTVASGPTVLDRSTIDDARAVMSKYDLLRACKLPNCELRETPKDPVYFKKVKNVLAMGNKVAIEAMRQEAKRLGYRARVHSTTLVGEARDVGRRLAALPKPGEMVLAAGETTVTVRGKGKGGRNQELALGALLAVGDDGLVLSCASDGVDNSPVAGAIADAGIRIKAKKLRLDPVKFLAANNSLEFFRKTDGHIRTGVTGANVSDLMIAARSKM
jgi:glycerate-2-kinase